MFQTVSQRIAARLHAGDDPQTAVAVTLAGLTVEERREYRSDLATIAGRIVARDRAAVNAQGSRAEWQGR